MGLIFGSFRYILHISLIPGTKFTVAYVTVKISKEEGTIKFLAEAEPVRGIYTFTGHRKIWYRSVLKKVEDEIITLSVESGEWKRRKTYSRKRRFREEDMVKDWSAFAMEILEGRDVKQIRFEGNELWIERRKDAIIVKPLNLKRKIFKEIEIELDSNMPRLWKVKRVLGIADVIIVRAE